jgi:hypothetical protein
MESLLRQEELNRPPRVPGAGEGASRRSAPVPEHLRHHASRHVQDLAEQVGNPTPRLSR